MAISRSQSLLVAALLVLASAGGAAAVPGAIFTTFGNVTVTVSANNKITASGSVSYTLANGTAVVPAPADPREYTCRDGGNLAKTFLVLTNSTSNTFSVTLPKLAVGSGFVTCSTHPQNGFADQGGLIESTPAAYTANATPPKVVLASPPKTPKPTKPKPHPTPGKGKKPTPKKPTKKVHPVAKGRKPTPRPTHRPGYSCIRGRRYRFRSGRAIRIPGKC